MSAIDDGPRLGPSVYTLAQVGELMGLSYIAAYSAWSRGRLPEEIQGAAIKYGRRRVLFPRSVVDRVLQVA